MMHKERLNVRLATVNALWQAFSVVFVGAFSLLVLKEQINAFEWGGLGVITAGFFLLFLGSWREGRRK